MKKNLPNFLFFVTDQHHPDCLGCYGNKVLKTLNIDRIAQNGVRFERAYVNNPLCMPSRSTLFTGKTPRGHHVRTNGISLSWDEKTLPEVLGRLGYRTHSVGKIHLRPFGIPLGYKAKALDPKEFPESRDIWHTGMLSKFPEPYFGLQTINYIGGHGDYVYGDYFIDLNKKHPSKSKLLNSKSSLRPLSGAQESWKSAIPEELHISTWVGDRTIEFLEKEGDKPFFLWCSFPDPHHPFCPPAPWCDMYKPEKIPLPNMLENAEELNMMPPHFQIAHKKGLMTAGTTTRPTKMSEEEIREIRSHYYGMIGLIDKNIGRILHTLDKMNLTKSTVVVFLADHGELLGDHGLCFKGPFHYEGLVRVPFIWQWSDHFPKNRVVHGLVSLLDFVPTILEIAGSSIPEVSAPPKPIKSWMSWASIPGKSLVPLLSGEKDNLQSSVLIENDEDYLGLRLRTIVTDRYKLTIYQNKEYGELFDLQEDPAEYRNLWDSPAYRKVRKDLVWQLLHKLVETDNPLPRRICHA